MAITFEEKEVLVEQEDGTKIKEKRTQRRWETLEDLYKIRRGCKEDGSYNKYWFSSGLAAYSALWEYIAFGLCKAFNPAILRIKNGYAIVLLGPLLIPYWTGLTVLLLAWLVLAIPIYIVLVVWACLFEFLGDLINNNYSKEKK